MKNKRKSIVRPGHIVFLLAAVIITLLLAWWQWTRFRSGSGTLQNLGYALQWPIFGGALVWAYRKYVRLETELANSENAATSPGNGSSGNGSDLAASQGTSEKANHAHTNTTQSHAQSNQVNSSQGSTQNLHAGAEMTPEMMVPQRPTIDVEEFNRLNTPRRGHNEGDR